MFCPELRPTLREDVWRPAVRGHRKSPLSQLNFAAKRVSVMQVEDGCLYAPPGLPLQRQELADVFVAYLSF